LVKRRKKSIGKPPFGPKQVGGGAEAPGEEVGNGTDAARKAVLERSIPGKTQDGKKAKGQER